MKTSRARDEAGTKAKTSEQNNSHLRDEEGPYAKARQENTTRLRDEKKPHAGEVRRAQGAEQTIAIGN